MTQDAVPGQPFADLERYAGWLGKDHVSVEVRASVRALGAAIDVGADTVPLVETLTRDMGRLPGGDLRTMLQSTLARLNVVLNAGGVDVARGDGS